MSPPRTQQSRFSPGYALCTVSSLALAQIYPHATELDYHERLAAGGEWLASGRLWHGLADQKVPPGRVCTTGCHWLLYHNQLTGSNIPNVHHAHTSRICKFQAGKGALASTGAKDKDEGGVG